MSFLKPLLHPHTHTSPPKLRHEESKSPALKRDSSYPVTSASKLNGSSGKSSISPSRNHKGAEDAAKMIKARFKSHFYECLVELASDEEMFV